MIISVHQQKPANLPTLARKVTIFVVIAKITLRNDTYIFLTVLVEMKSNQTCDT